MMSINSRICLLEGIITLLVHVTGCNMDCKLTVLRWGRRLQQFSFVHLCTFLMLSIKEKRTVVVAVKCCGSNTKEIIKHAQIPLEY